jgi:hypothetical protein
MGAWRIRVNQREKEEGGSKRGGRRATLNYGYGDRVCQKMCQCVIPTGRLSHLEKIISLEEGEKLHQLVVISKHAED